MAFWAIANTLLAKTQLLDFKLKHWYSYSITKLLTPAAAAACLFRAIMASASFDLLFSAGFVSHWCVWPQPSGWVDWVLWACAVILSLWDDPTTALASCQPSLACQSTLWGHPGTVYRGHSLAHLSSITQFETALIWAYAAKAWSKLTHA